ncbi:MAG TPA: YbaK/EbsC family protein [Mycobacteriales bacterium]|jgi:prolyl-tRNA editing enzyme YbaK/EbsC (Cys-tRNA(Pro) deacylase)|nr:YbaK/EbsC family protein [Mycobacteriales bacterium]
MRGPVDVTRRLIDAEVLHEIVHLPRRIDSAVELPDVLGLPGTSCVAVRLFDADDALLAALLPADAAVATTALARAVGARTVRPTPAARVSEVTDSHPGLVPPVGLPAFVTAVADAAVGDQEVVYAPTGDGSTALKVRAADLLALLDARVAPLVEPGPVVLPAGDPWRETPAALRR